MIINRGRFEFRCTPELHEAIKWAAYRRHQSVNAYLTQVLTVAVQADIDAENARQQAAAAVTTPESVEHNGSGRPLG